MRTRSRTMMCRCDAGYTESRALGAHGLFTGPESAKTQVKRQNRVRKGKVAALAAMCRLGHIFARGWMGKTARKRPFVGSIKIIQKRLACVAETAII